MRTLVKVIRNTALTVVAIAAAAGITGASLTASIIAIEGGTTVAMDTTQRVAGVASPVVPVDPTVSYAFDASNAPTCAQLGLVSGVVTVHGTRTVSYAGCINPISLGLGDSFAGRLPQLLANASK